MEKTIQKNKISFFGIIQIVVIFLSIILSIYFYLHFPAKVPTHWNITGEANGWSPKFFGAFFFPILLIVMYFLFELLPKIDPRRERYAEFSKGYSVIKTTMMLLFFGIYLIMGLNSLGFTVSVSFWVPFLIGVMFIVIGRYLGEIRGNFFVGIRTPWTLSSEVVWDKTHKFGGKMFILGGLLMVIMGFLPVFLRMPTLIILLIIIAVFPIIYSYIEYKKLPK